MSCNLCNYLSGIILIISLNFIGLNLCAQNIVKNSLVNKVDSIQVKINLGNLIIQTIPSDVMVEIPKLRVKEMKNQDSLILDDIYAGLYNLSFDYEEYQFKCSVKIIGQETLHVVVDVKEKKLQTNRMLCNLMDKEIVPVIDNQIYIMVEEMPEFPGGILELRKWIKSNMKYPETARKNKITGKVYIGFVINKEGKVEGGKVLRSVDPLLDSEALRVINNMPKWKPGKQKGKPVKVSFSFPIKFYLH